MASIRAGLRIIGRGMGGTPTCRGEARGCRMRGEWLKGEVPWTGDAVNGTGMGEMVGGAEDPEKTRDKNSTKTVHTKDSHKCFLYSSCYFLFQMLYLRKLSRQVYCQC